MAHSACSPSYNPSKSLSEHLLSPHSHDHFSRDRQRISGPSFRSVSADAARTSNCEWSSFARGDNPRSQLEACPPHLPAPHATSSASAFSGWSNSAYTMWSRSAHPSSTSAASLSIDVAGADANPDDEYSTAWSPESETLRAVSPSFSTSSSHSYILSTPALARSTSSGGSMYPLSPHRSPWSDFGSTSASTSGTEPASGWATPTVEEVEALVWTKSDEQGRLSISAVDKAEAGQRAREWVGQYSEGRGGSPAPHPITLTPNNDAEWDFDRLFGQARFSAAAARPVLGMQRASSRLRDEVVASGRGVKGDLEEAQDDERRTAVVYEALKDTAMRRLAAVQAHFTAGGQI